MYSPLKIAEFFIKRGLSEGIPIDNMKLQKLIYFAHGSFLAEKNQPLINEYVEAWKYGPVVPFIYHSFKESGNDPIDEKGLVKATWGYWGPNEREEISLEDLQLLENVWEALREYSGPELSSLTHIQGSPWEQTYRTSGGVKGKDIDNDLIGQYFRENYS